jgi:hypothetical protein
MNYFSYFTNSIEATKIWPPMSQLYEPRVPHIYKNLSKFRSPEEFRVIRKCSFCSSTLTAALFGFPQWFGTCPHEGTCLKHCGCDARMPGYYEALTKRNCLDGMVCLMQWHQEREGKMSEFGKKIRKLRKFNGFYLEREESKDE